MVAYTILRPTQVIIITQPLCILNRCLCGLSGKRAVTRHHPHSVAFANVNHCQWQTTAFIALVYALVRHDGKPPQNQDLNGVDSECDHLESLGPSDFQFLSFERYFSHH